MEGVINGPRVQPVLPILIIILIAYSSELRVHRLLVLTSTACSPIYGLPSHLQTHILIYGWFSHLQRSENMTNFRSLPLELRSIIYEYALQDNHDFFTDGVPALFKVCPHITREIYSYRKIVTTVSISSNTPGLIEKEDLHRAIITKFNQKQNTKGLLVKFVILKPSRRMDRLTAVILEALDGGYAALGVRLFATELRMLMGVETEVYKESSQAI